jgi:hypothetical protein
VAGFALQIRKRRIRICSGAMFCVKDRHGWLFSFFAMTGNAGIGAAAGVLLAMCCLRDDGADDHQQ